MKQVVVEAKNEKVRRSKCYPVSVVSCHETMDVSPIHSRKSSLKRKSSLAP